MRIWRGKWISLGFLCGFLLLFSGSPALAVYVNALYKEHCIKCHGEEGKGDGPTMKKQKGKAIDWTDKAEMAKLADQDLFEIIWQGGKGVGKSKIMPGYKTKLTEEEAKALVPFSRSFAK